MRLDRLVAAVQLLGDVGDAHAVADHRENLPLTLGERIQLVLQGFIHGGRGGPVRTVAGRRLS